MRRSAAMLLVSTFLLLAIGLLMVLSASSIVAYSQTHSSFYYFERQAAYALVGVVAMFVAARIDYHVWERLALPFMGLSMVLLALVLHPSTGVSAYGASRWIAFGPVNIQPSEVAKLATVVFVATFLAKKWKKLDDIKELALPIVPGVGLICLMIMLQPDLGTTMIIAGTAFLMMFLAGVRMRWLTVSALAGGGLVMGLIMSAPYRRARFFSFLHPQADPQGSGYQVIQSLYALAGGGLLGKGLGESLQKWFYLPNAPTDFIFAILGEELGLVGEIVVLALFGMLVLSAVRIVSRAPDVFGKLLGGGVVALLGLQIVMNLGAVTGLLPVVGVPLPLISYGGSSLVVTLTCVGILLSIARAATKKVRRPAK
jgi:cell division protein FtsW